MPQSLANLDTYLIFSTKERAYRRLASAHQ